MRGCICRAWLGRTWETASTHKWACNANHHLGFQSINGCHHGWFLQQYNECLPVLRITLSCGASSCVPLCVRTWHNTNVKAREWLHRVCIGSCHRKIKTTYSLGRGSYSCDLLWRFLMCTIVCVPHDIIQMWKSQNHFIEYALVLVTENQDTYIELPRFWLFNSVQITQHQCCSVTQVSVYFFLFNKWWYLGRIVYVITSNNLKQIEIRYDIWLVCHLMNVSLF